MRVDEIDMQAFCNGDTRYKIGQPFVQNNLEFAMDGRLVVVIPTNKMDTPAKEKPFPDMAALLSDRKWVKGGFAITKPELSNKDCVYCDDCGGDGRETVKCELCRGEEVCNRCVCGYEHECGWCHGDGHTHTGPKCSECSGTGKGYDKQRIGGAFFNGAYLSRIAKRLPNPVTEKIGRDAEGKKPCMKFNFDGGYGYLMGLADD